MYSVFDTTTTTTEDYCLNLPNLKTLSLREVRKIHEALKLRFAQTDDPIEPSGERAGGMLESAVGRQTSGINGNLYYPDPISNAASLAYALCKNHPFANGNKRTALVSMLVHLDKNRKVIRENTDHRSVYNFILSLAQGQLHKISSPPVVGDLRGRLPESYKVQLACCTAWLRMNTRDIHRGDRPIRMRDLKRLLANFGYELNDPQQNFADIYKIEEVVQRRWLRSPIKKSVRNKVFQIACASMNQTVEVDTIKRIRKQCGLRETDGVDSDAFYNGLDRLDYYLNAYRNILKQLARE